MSLTEKDVVCCPPPLFHCFGLVMGFLASFCHGSSIVFPSDKFNAQKTLEAIVKKKATVLLGVPTMFYAELEALAKLKCNINTVRTGLIAGSPVPRPLMHRIQNELHTQGMLIAYGMTETSPVTFITSLDDDKDKMCNTIGRVLPHTSAKVINLCGNTVPRGVRGELCTSGFALQKGYWKDEAKTKESMKKDENGIIWMHTGDEAFIDEEGYGHITGRIKDLIIRGMDYVLHFTLVIEVMLTVTNNVGGENISPVEIESRLLTHPEITECCVVGLADSKYGEVVGCFLRVAEDSARLSDEEVRRWVMEALGHIKAPQYIFWLGESSVPSELPKTASGKYQKHLIRDKGNSLVNSRKRQAAL